MNQEKRKKRNWKEEVGVGNEGGSNWGKRWKNWKVEGLKEGKKSGGREGEERGDGEGRKEFTGEVIGMEKIEGIERGAGKKIGWRNRKGKRDKGIEELRSWKAERVKELKWKVVRRVKELGEREGIWREKSERIAWKWKEEWWKRNEMRREEEWSIFGRRIRKSRTEAYLHCETWNSQRHDHTCAKLKEEYKEKYEEIEWAVTPGKEKGEEKTLV